MKRTKAKRHISMLLIICVLVSGMCYGIVHADSIFLCRERQDQVAVISRVMDKLPSQDMYIEEESAAEECYGYTTHIRRSREKDSFLHMPADLSSTENLPKYSLRHFKRTGEQAHRENSSAAVIVRYIQQQDGEKR